MNIWELRQGHGWEGCVYICVVPTTTQVKVPLSYSVSTLRVLTTVGTSILPGSLKLPSMTL